MKNKNNKNNKVLSHDESANKKIKLKSIDGKDFGEVSVSAFSAIKFGMLDKYSPVDDAEKKNLDAYKQHISARYPDKKEPVSLDKWREETPVISAGGNSSPQKKATPKKTAESRTENTKVNMNSLKFFEDNTPNIFEKYGLNPDTFDRQDFEDWAVRHNFEYANRTGLKYEWLPKLSSDPKKMFDTVATEQDIKDKNVLERFVEEKELVNNAKKHPVISSAKTIVTSPVRSVAAGLALAKDTASTILTGKTNTNDAWHEYVEDADIIRQTVNDEYSSKWFDGASGKLGNYGSMVYNGAMSIGDMVTAAATMRALGTAIGLSGNALAAFTSNTTSGLSASNSGASTIIQKKKEGLSDAQSVANGIASAAAEFITKKISFDLIFKKPSSFIKKGFVSFISEGSEEMTSDMLTKTADRFISGDDSEIRKSINAYMQSGMTKEEATKKTIEDSIWQTLSAGLVGGVSGVAVSGVYHGFNKPQIKRVGKDIRGSADNIVKSGLDFQSNSTAYKYAQKLLKKGIGNVSDYELGLQHIYNTEQAAYEQKKAEKIAKKEANNINGEQSQNDFSDSTTQQTENVSNFDNGETINNAEQVQTDNVQAQTVNTDETPSDSISTDSVVTENNPNINNNMRNIFLKQVGDYYEAYGMSAAELADKLNLHVTKKNGQYMVGFPVSALHGYADKLNMDMQQFGDDDWSGIKLVPKETATAVNESVSNNGIAQTGANVNDNVSESAKSDIADVNKVGNTAPGTAKGISVNTNELPVKFTNVNEARREFVKYTHENFPQSVVNANTLSNIGISRTGIDKFLSGNISLQKYSTGFKIPELIESAVKVGEAENKKGKSGINGYEYYENSIKIDGENFAVHIRVRNTDMGDKYYGHTISRTVDEIKIEPLAWNSDTKSVHPINASSSDTNIVSQDADNVNNNLSESEKSDVNRSTLPEAYRYDEGGKVRFNQLDINYNNPNMRGGDFNVMQKDGSYKTVRGVLCGKYGIEKVNDNTFNIIHLQSGINPATFDTVSEAKTVVKQLNSMFDYNDVRYTKSVSEDGSEKYTLDWDESLDKYYNEIMTYIGTQTNGAVSENDTNINNNAMQTENGKKITVDMSDEERAEILKNKSINVAMVDDERTRKFENVDIDKLQSSLLRYAKPIIEKVASDFGILNKTYFNPDIELEFEYSKNSLKESMNKQQFRYGDFVKMLSVFPDVISNAVGVETHNDKYKGTTRENTSLKQMYVLASAVMDETGIIPVKLEVKEFNDRKNKLYLTVALTKKESGDLHASLGQNQLHTATPTLTISISDLVGIVNPKDGNFLKYFPDNMLDAEQIEGKRKTIEQDAKKIDKLVAGDRSVSALNNDNSANNANNRKKLYDVYRRMKDRCYNSAAKDYKYYGDKGVKVNKNWLDSFEAFYRWALDNGYEDGLTIDRIDPYGDYEPSNCRWVTMSEQNRNKRSNNVENSDRVLNNRSESAIIDNSNYIDAEGAKITVDISDEERTDLTESVNNSSDNITEVIKNTLHPGILSNSELMNELSEMFGGNGVDGLVNEVISQYNETNSLGSFERLFINNGEEVYKALQNEDKYVRFSLTDDVLNSINAKRSKSSLSESVVYKNNPENDNLSKKANHSKKSKLQFDEDNSGIRYSLAGEKAKTADAEALAKAKQMERGGASPEEIWRETGWGKGIDGKWRFEIDNSSAEFDKQGFTENPDILRKRELTDKFLNAIISDEEMRELQSLNSATNGVIKPTKLSDYFKNKELFEAYPELGDIPVRFEKLEKGTHGSYNPDTNSITLNSLDSAEKNKQTLIHEIQHSIQKQEGFAGGSSPSTAGSMAAYKNTVGEIEARDAANRMDMTAEERRANFPESMKSDESVVFAERGGENFSIITLDNGNEYVQADRQILFGNNVSDWRKSITQFFKRNLKNGDIDIKATDGSILTITKDTAIKSGDNYKLENNKRIKLSNNEFLIKLHAEGHIDELSEISMRKSTAADNKNHNFAKNGFEYRTVYFKDYDGKEYKITLSIGKNNGISTVYNVGKIKTDTIPAGKIISRRGGQSPMASISANTSIPRSGEKVKDFFLKSNIEQSKDLIAVHNIDEKNLMSAMDLGALVMPSIAVTKSEFGHEGFGDITLLFDKSSIDPETNADNKVYGGDAYTPMFPSTVSKPDENAVKALADKLGTSPSYLSTNYFNETSATDAAENLGSDILVKEAFAKDNGLTVEPVLRDPKANYPWHNYANVKQFIAEHSFSEIVNNADIEQAYINTILNGDDNDSAFVKRRRSKSAQMAKELIDDVRQDKNLYSDAENRYGNDALIAKGIAEKVEDSYSYRDGLDNLISEHQADYEKYVMSLVNNVMSGKYIRNNQDVYTSRGDMRNFDELHEEYTVDNVLNKMKSELQKGQSSLFTGSQNVRGAVTMGFENIPAIKKSSFRLKNLSETDAKNIKSEFSDRLYNITSEAVEGTHFDLMYALNDFSGVIVETLNNSDTPKSFINNLKKYGKGYNITPKITKDVISLLTDMRNAPVKYFEAKPQRAVSFSEVLAAIVPDTVSEELKAALNSRGIEIISYDHTDKSSRLHAVNQAADKANVRFSIKRSGGVNDKNSTSKTINNSEVKGNGQRGNVLYRGSERSGYESAGEQIRGVQKTQFSDFGQTESERKAAAKEVLAKRQTQKQVISIGKHGIAGKVQINAINPEAYNEDMRSMVDAYAKQGIDVTLYIGDGRVAFDSHHEFRVNGFKVGNSKMYIRYDGKCSPQMLGMHEAVHIYWNNEDTISVKEYILGVLTEDEKNDILNSERYQDYMQLYNGDTEAVWQEFVADTLSGMNEFTDDFADTVNEYWNNKTELADSYRVAEYARSIDAGGGVNTDVSFATNKADLSRYEYAMVSKAVMSKNAGLSDNDLKPVDYVFAGDFCYVYENHSIGEFTVVDKLDPETDYDIIDRIMEDVKNAYNTNREVLNRWSEDIRSGERGYNRNNGRTENRRSAMGNDRLSSGKSGSDSVGYSSEDGSNKAQGKIKFSLDSNADFWEKWINKAEKYGVIPKGENPVRDVDVPKQISKKKYVSRFARTLLESGVTPDDTVSEFEKAILDGKMTYEVVSDKSAREKAEQEIKENGFAESLRDWDYIVRHGDMDKNKFAFGMQLYNQCISNKDVANAMKIAAELSAEATRAGQTIQAVRMLKQMSPDGQLYYIERSVKKLNDDFKKRLGDKFKDIQLDENLMNEFFSEKDKKKRDNIYEDICQNIADQIPATWQDKFNSWRYLAMLGNLKTHVRNVVGNAMFSLPKTVSYYISAATESASKIKTENRTKSFFKTAASKKFAEQDFKEMVKVLQGENAKYAVTTDIEGKRRIFKNGVIELFRRKNFDFLEAEDMFFLKRYYTDYLARTITARKLDVNNMSESDLYQVRMYAVKEAQAATFRDANALAEGLSRVQHQWMNSKNAGKVAGAVLMEGTVPFKKTPLNIAKQAMNFSPLGLVRGIVSACTDLRTGKKTATEVIEILANGLTGTAIALLGAFLAHIGILVGPGDDNKKKREFDKMTGKQTFALCINGHYYTIDWMAPAVLPLFMGERIYALSKGSLSFRDIADSATTLLDPMIELSVLSGVNDLFKNAQNSGASTALSDAAISMITSYIGQIFPTLGGQLARITDNKKRNYYYIDKNSAIPKVIQKLMGNAASKIPGMGKLYEPMIDAWGREITQGEIPERVLENTISPGYYSNENYTFIDRVIEDLYERTGDAAVLPTVQAKYYTDDYKRYDLTAKQWTTAQKIRGQKSLKYASDLISNKEIVNVKVNGTMVQMTWSDMNDRQKVNALSKMYKRAGDETKEEILRMMK